MDNKQSLLHIGIINICSSWGNERWIQLDDVITNKHKFKFVHSYNKSKKLEKPQSMLMLLIICKRFISDIFLVTKEPSAGPL